MSVRDPNVWSGRALQEVFVDLVVSGLASMYPVSSWSCFAPDHHGYQRACDLINGQASTGHPGHQCSHAPGRPILHLYLSSRRPRLETVDRVTSSLAPHTAQFLCSSLGRSFVPARMYGPAVRCKRFVDLVVSGLASMYPVSSWSRFAPDHHGYQRACDLINGQASTGPCGSPVFACAGKTDPPSLLILSQTSAGKGIDYVIDSLLGLRCSFVRA